MDEGRVAVPYDATWAERAAHECARLAEMSSGAEHVGTTSIPGCAGRPVIDLLVGVRMLDRRADLVAEALRARDYEIVPSRFPGALALHRHGSTQFDVFLVEYGGREWKRAIALRDYLRRNGDEARSYARGLKEAEAAASTAGAPDAYDAAKQRLFTRFGGRAEQWRRTHPRG